MDRRETLSISLQSMPSPLSPGRTGPGSVPVAGAAEVTSPGQKRRRTGESASPDGTEQQQPQQPQQPQQSLERGLMRRDSKQQKQKGVEVRFVGSGSGIFFIRNVYLRLLARKSHKAVVSNSASKLADMVPGEDDQAPKRNEEPLWRAGDEVIDGDGSRPSFEQLVDWSRSYFELWHAALPFLNAPSLLENFVDISRSAMDGLSPTDKLMVKSVFSISLADSRQGRPLSPPILSWLVFPSVDEALVGAQLALRQPASMQTVQAAFAVTLFLVSMLRLNSASRLGGLIIRLAFQVGLHRCPSRFPLFGVKDGEMRRRMFWSLYVVDRFLCMSLGLPLDIRDDDVDVCFPGEEVHSTATPVAADMDKRLKMMTYLAKHARIRGLILELRNKSIHIRNDTTEEAEAVHAALAKWANEVHDDVEECSDGEGEAEDALPLAHRLWLRLLRQESLISLNRPLMAFKAESASYASGLQNCIAAARGILITLKQYQSRYCVAEHLHRLSVPMVWPSVTWAVWISVFVLVYAAVEKQLSVAAALRSIAQAKQILRHVAARDTAWPEYCLSAMDDLVTALDEHSTATGVCLPVNKELRPDWPDTGDAQPIRDVSLPHKPEDETDCAVDVYQSVPNISGVFLPPGPVFDAAVPASYGSNPHVPTEQSLLASWYNQLYGETFNAIDYPFLATTQLDPSTDPRWSYMRS